MNIPVRALSGLDSPPAAAERVAAADVGMRATGRRGARSQGPAPIHAYLWDSASEAVADSLSTRLGMAVRVQGGGLPAAVEVLRSHPSPKCLIVDIAAATDVMAQIDALAEVCDPETKVVALGDHNDINLFRQLQGAGIADYLVKPIGADALFDSVHAALKLQEANAAASRSNAPLGKLIGFIGARGGVGASSLALNCGALIAAEKGLEVVVADLDLQFGTLALSLDLDAGFGLREALEYPSRVDRAFLAHAVVKAGERLSIFGAEEDMDDAFLPAADATLSLLQELRRSYECVVVDFPRRDAARWAGLIDTGSLVAVTDLSLAGLRDTARLLALARNVDGTTAVTVVANKVGSTNGIEQAEFEKTLGRAIDFAVPEDGRALWTALKTAGTLVQTAKGAKITGALRKMADHFVGDGKQQKRSAFWQRVIKR